MSRVPTALILLSLVAGSWCEAMEADKVGRHTMSRIAALLSLSECRQLQRQLEGPKEDLGKPELPGDSNRPRGPCALCHRPGCSGALRRWLELAGKGTSWDLLVRSLYKIGRHDIARELGKNLNQDRSLELRRNVEEYGRTVQHLTSSRLLPQGEQPAGARGRRALARGMGDLGELRFERRPPPPYTRSLRGWVSSVAYGILGGFLASVFTILAAAYSCHWLLGLDTT
ncbi:transmembrane and death domain protein 1 [Anser cygnoides]|uniref:transmembrane and death domain protein 1 n=1 Tax=Anser cygnoides TaxID=8845 RepID=UPI002009B444|nr:transmembrane and death domain protein 1 [Anser cygnoides]